MVSEATTKFKVSTESNRLWSSNWLSKQDLFSIEVSKVKRYPDVQKW